MREVTFYMNMGGTHTELEETFTFEQLGVSEDLSGSDLEKEVKKAFESWVWDNLHTSYEYE